MAAQPIRHDTAAGPQRCVGVVFDFLLRQYGVQELETSNSSLPFCGTGASRVCKDGETSTECSAVCRCTRPCGLTPARRSGRVPPQRARKSVVRGLGSGSLLSPWCCVCGALLPEAWRRSSVHTARMHGGVAPFAALRPQRAQLLQPVFFFLHFGHFCHFSVIFSILSVFFHCFMFFFFHFFIPFIFFIFSFSSFSSFLFIFLHVLSFSFMFFGPATSRLALAMFRNVALIFVYNRTTSDSVVSSQFTAHSSKTLSCKSFGIIPYKTATLTLAVNS